MQKALDRRVRRRARDACEYCLMPQSAYRFSFPLDHIIAQQHGGNTEFRNLALACLRCNRHKGPNIAGLDPQTGRLVRLFHPRRDAWTEHFRYRGPVLMGLSAIGRATISVLSINHPRVAEIRRALIEEGIFPPKRTTGRPKA